MQIDTFEFEVTSEYNDYNGTLYSVEVRFAGSIVAIINDVGWSESTAIEEAKRTFASRLREVLNLGG